MKKTVLGLVGPTASGKTALSLAAARELHGNILCMDSMQIYQKMDIGTAKPTLAERAAAPHYLVDFLQPDESFSVSDYAEMAKPLLDTLPCPILVGGTGLYLQALSQGMEMGGVSGDEALRARYHLMAETEGSEAVHRVLEKYDPETAARLHPNDLRRVIRAIEVYELTGIPLSRQRAAQTDDAPYNFLLFAVDWPREELYARVETRVDEMMRQGLLDEVAALVRMGIGPDAQSMQGLGYKELYPVVTEHADLNEAVSLIKLRTRHYAKRQLTWFGRDKRITWLPCTMTKNEMLETVLNACRSADEAERA